MSTRIALLFTFIAFASPATAQTGDAMPPALLDVMPPDTAVREALATHPSVEAARQRIGTAQADADALAIGPHEFVASATFSRRDVQGEPTYGEVEATVMRAIRLPGRRRLDQAAGRFGVIAADNVAADVEHQAALQLNDLLWDYLTAQALVTVDETAVANLAQALAATARRVALRDAALIDRELAEAALAAGEAALERSRGLALTAQARMTAQFPSLPPPRPAGLPAPDVTAGAIEIMHDQVIARSHEVAAADAQSQRMAAMAGRARLERIADPSVGLRLFRDRGGQESGAGIIVSMPIGGRHRSALADRAAAEAGAAQQDRAAVQRSVAEMAAADRAMALSALAVWERSRDAIAMHVSVTTRTRRGYVLGAIDLADVLLAERQARDAFRIEAEARADALRAITRLMIDSHNLWIGDEDDH